MPVWKQKEFRIALGIILTGLAALALAATIPPGTDAGVGPRFVPVILACGLLALGLAAAVSSWLSGDAAPPAPREENRQGGMFRVVVVTALGFVYVLMLGAVGYALSTLIVLALLLVLFGTRRPLRLALISTAGAAIYYLIFVRQLGMYDPAGWLIDLSDVL